METATSDAVEVSNEASVRLDERALRRADFATGEVVTLADGQGWSIPCPRLVYVPAIGQGGEFGVKAASTFGPEFDRKVAALQEADTVPREAVALLALAVDLVGRNYDVPPADLPTLLRYETVTEGGRPGMEDIYRIATGFGVVAPAAAG